MSGQYDFVQKGALKLKGVSDGGIKKKKKKSKKSHKDLDEPWPPPQGPRWKPPPGTKN